MRLPGWVSVGRGLAKALVGAALLGFVTANLGLPLIVPASPLASQDAATGGKDKSIPFPCQDRPCGCLSADACMRSCCCFSAQERLAWFRAHNITPLPELIAAAEAAGHVQTHEACAKTADACAHCAKTGAKTEKKSAAGGCCSTKKAAADESTATGSPVTEPEAKGWRVVLVIGSFAAECQGMGPWSLTSILAAPPAAVVAYSFDWSSAEDVPAFVPSLLSAIHSPRTRPPCC